MIENLSIILIWKNRKINVFSVKYYGINVTIK